MGVFVFKNQSWHLILIINLIFYDVNISSEWMYGMHLKAHN